MEQPEEVKLSRKDAEALIDRLKNDTSTADDRCVLARLILQLSASQGLPEYIRQRWIFVAKAGTCLFFDALLLVLWLTIAWMAESIAHFFQEHGANELFASAFKYVSSGGVFIFALVYIIRDIIEEFATLFRKK